jgi:hypothetical protein
MLQHTLPSAPAAPVAPPTVCYFVSVVTDDLYGFYIQLEDSYLALGHKEQIHAAAQVRYPGCVVIDWRVCRPQA